ncbi:hypothetical protein C8Q79DRAFT_1006203 [Trametes meyenii]|nr:hypothetical protein C8Q79DRAFT_1006203 [Trametes meyenii]
MGPSHVKMHAWCLPELRALGFNISPLQCKFEELLRYGDVEALTMKTSLSSSIPCFEHDQEAVQWIDVKIVLVAVPEHLMDASMQAAGDVTVHFSVKNTFHIPQQPPFSGETAPYEVKVAPCSDGDDGTRTVGLERSATDLHGQASFFIHADPDWEQDAFVVRVLRLTLEGTSGEW